MSSWRGYAEDIYFPDARRNRLIALALVGVLVFGIVYKIVDAAR